MLPRALTWWVLQRAVRSPILLVTGLVAGALVPLMTRLSPWTGHHGNGPAEEIAKAWLGPLGILGTVFGLYVFAEGRDFLLRIAPRPRCASLAIGLLVVPVVLQGLLALGAAWEGGSEILPVLAEQGAVQDLFLLSLALITWSLDVPTQTRLALFLGIVWLLPALLADGFLGQAMIPFRAPLVSREGMGPFAPWGESALLWLSGQAALLGAAWLMNVPARPTRA